MLEKKLHIWSLFRGRCWWGLLLSQPQTRRVGVGKHEVIKVLKVDFFALLYIVKKERIMYIEILFWIKNMSITTRTFARITKKILWKAEQNCLHQKGTEFLLSYPFQKRPSVALLFCQQLVVCQVTFRKRSTTLQRKGLAGFVWSPNLPVWTGLCVMATPSQAQPITTRPVSLLRGMHVKGNTYAVKKKHHNTVILNKKTCYRKMYLQYTIFYQCNGIKYIYEKNI